ncbi:hypothetical protein BpHYR1_018583 [Brachionus plicatilis]|uniref:Uncharacterized protein n=1 Tax=Brachionus plicatilis TaxID=10195 RepID=A0A3M7QIM2_BRAPC|nr:hypothetical protein BpHYR1_018583 [Brachionus plicatilis]
MKNLSELQHHSSRKFSKQKKKHCTILNKPTNRINRNLEQKTENKKLRKILWKRVVHAQIKVKQIMLANKQNDHAQHNKADKTI